MSEKFRSIAAFRDFEQKKLGGSPGQEGAMPESEEVSPLRVLSVLKKHAEGMVQSEIAKELGASPRAVERACLTLLGEGLLRVEPGKGGEEERLLAS